ncbi:MAG: PQQ-like beta-propeller repeat protein, partial [Kiritimatiellae bacterium]|nr:PQQ-like beta-propeller repeat protein [Kiritimatiellia bacterium]
AGVVVCLDAKKGAVYWTREFPEGFYASPILVGERVYALDRKGNMRIFRAGETYQEVSSCPIGEAAVATPAFVEGRIFIRGERHLYCIGK